MPRDLSEKDIARFHASSKRQGECLLWTGGTYPNGYGRFHANRKTYRASRLAYFLHHGVDPASKLVCHSCDNPACVETTHLWLGTAKQNSADMVAKGRFSTTPIKRLVGKRPPRTHCRKGHELPLRKGYVRCRICYNQWARERYTKSRQQVAA